MNAMEAGCAMACVLVGCLAMSKGSAARVAGNPSAGLSPANSQSRRRRKYKKTKDVMMEVQASAAGVQACPYLAAWGEHALKRRPPSTSDEAVQFKRILSITNI